MPPIPSPKPHLPPVEVLHNLIAQSMPLPMVVATQGPDDAWTLLLEGLVIVVDPIVNQPYR